MAPGPAQVTDAQVITGKPVQGRDLAQLGPEAARFIPALQRSLQDDDRSARHEASGALARIEGMFHAKP